MQKVELPKFNVNDLSPDQRAELSRQLVEAQAASSTAEIAGSAEITKKNIELPPITRSAALVVETNIPTDLSSVKIDVPKAGLEADSNQPAENLSNLLDLVQEGQFIAKSGESLTDLNAFMNNLNERLANPKPADLDPKK